MVAFKDRVEDGKTLEKRLRDEILEPRYLPQPRFAKTRRAGRTTQCYVKMHSSCCSQLKSRKGNQVD